jgi:hypothetical protein
MGNIDSLAVADVMSSVREAPSRSNSSGGVPAPARVPVLDWASSPVQPGPVTHRP